LVKHEGGDVNEIRKARNNSGSSIESRLDGGESDLKEADKKRVAVVNSKANKGMDYCSHGRCGNRFAGLSKVAKRPIRETTVGSND